MGLAGSANGQGAGATPAATPGPTRDPMWRCTLPGGTYEVALKWIISASTHQYSLEGGARVTELNVDTPGNLAVRFYYIAPPETSGSTGKETLGTTVETAKGGSEETSPEEGTAWQRVVKNYPTTTHAHTVEYRLETAEDLETLFKSVDQALRTGVNTQVSLP